MGSERRLRRRALPSQVKNLEKRSRPRPRPPGRDPGDLRLRARSREAMTQVELARLQYLLPRLTAPRRAWRSSARADVPRRRRREKLELDRRKIRRRIATLKDELSRIEKAATCAPAPVAAGHRLPGRLHERRKDDALQPALVVEGAGRGPPLRHARPPARADARRGGAADRPLRHGRVPAQAPARLVASFKSTLREVEDSDLVVHVVDAARRRRTSSAASRTRCSRARRPEGAGPPRPEQVDLPGAGAGRPTACGLRTSGLGLEELRAAIVERLTALGVPIPLPSERRETAASDDGPRPLPPASSCSGPSRGRRPASSPSTTGSGA